MGEGPEQETEKKLEFKLIVDKIGDDQETLVDDDEDDVSCLDGADDSSGFPKRKGTLRLVIRSRAFL